MQMEEKDMCPESKQTATLCSVLGAYAYASCENQRLTYDIILQKPITLSFEKRFLIGLEFTN